jgi:hypothetical protein
MSRSTRKQTRGLARLLITTAVTGAVTIGVAGAASAASGAAAPPALAYAAPAEDGIAAAGDGGQEYWASDDCHYFARGGTWYSDMCMSAILDPAGNVVPDVVSDFQNLGGGMLGRELLRMDFETPGYMAFAPVTDVVGTWYAVPFDAPTAAQPMGTTMGGQLTPITYITPPNTQPRNTEADYNTSVAGLIHWMQVDNFYQSLTNASAGFIAVRP